MVRLTCHEICVLCDGLNNALMLLTNTSTRVSHTCDHICRVSMFYDVIIRYRKKIAFFGVPVTWCASAYNEDDVAGGS